MGFDQEHIRRRLYDLGFDEVRFAGAGTIPREHRERFERWLAEGKQADMKWMDRSLEKRLDLERVLAGVQSIIMLGVNYLPDADRALRQDRWAKYALYEDYHDTLKTALIASGRMLEEELGLEQADYRYYVDTGPVMERGWAARAGLGWQGKNGMLISRTHGNWLFLATLLVRFAFTPDPALTNSRFAASDSSGGVGMLCGSCTRCIEACPTRAITQPGIVDARLCISYQTIENKGVIPRELRPLIGSRIYGCDICLDVCPWNRFAQAGRQVLLSARYELAELTLGEILSLTQEDFSRVFARTPIKRLKWRGLLRNACVVAGNLAESEADMDDEIEELLPLLVRLGSHEEPMVRVHAVWAVHRLRPDRARQLLGAAREGEETEQVLEEYGAWEVGSPSPSSAVDTKKTDRNSDRF